MGMENAQPFDADLAALAVPTLLEAHAAGTAYSLTNAAAALVFGTTNPALTITAPGTYLVMATGLVNFNAATFAAVRNLTMKLRRTNNTAADLTGAGASQAFKTPIITLLTYSMCAFHLMALYTTVNSDDILTIFGGLDTVPTAGSLDAVASSIIATRLKG